MNSIALPSDLEQFAAQAVAAGRYRELDDVIRAGVELLQRQEAARAAFVTSLDEAVAESERDGWHSLDDVLGELDQIIEAAERNAA